MLPEALAILEIELLLPALLDRHGELEAAILRLTRDVATELLVDKNALDALLEATLRGCLHALVDEVLGVLDRLRLLGIGIALDPEHLLLEGPAMVERQDEELAVVPECHLIDTHFRSPDLSPSRLPISRRPDPTAQDNPGGLSCALYVAAGLP